MIGSFQFKRFHDHFLLTNDFGRHVFLTEQEFKQFTANSIDENHPRFQELKDKLFLYTGSKEEYIRSTEEYYREYNGFLFEPTSLLIIALTNACNNHCVYCQANGSQHLSTMTEAVADQIIKRIDEMPSKYVTVEFQGGEPLICFDLIQYMILQCEQKIKNKNIRFTLVSNLILLTEDMADFFAAHSVSVSTSLDGPQSLHDKNRPSVSGISSYEAVIQGKALLDERHIFGGAIQTTTAYSLSYPREIVSLYKKLGLHQIFIRPLTRLGEAAKRWKEIGYSAEEYLAFYRSVTEEVINRNLHGEEITDYLLSLFLAKIYHGKSPNYMELRSPCGAGIGQIAFTANGNVYTCDEGRMVAETGDFSFQIGNVFENGYEEWMNSPCNKAVCAASVLEGSPGCHHCVYKPYCGVCPVVNYALNGNINSNARERCKIYEGILDMLFEYIYSKDPLIDQLFQKWSDTI